MALTPRKAFRLIARYFEFSMATLQKDGAFMAELISNCTVYDYDTRIFWYGTRPTKGTETLSSVLSVKEDTINRQYWMKGILQSIPSDSDKSLTITLR